MAVVINGTTGVSGVDGSAGTPSYQGADSNTGIFFPAADTIAFAEGGAEAMRIDSSGNVLVNSTGASGAGKFHINAANGTSVNEYSGLTISNTDDQTKAVRIAYNTANDVGVIAASDRGDAWKSLALNPDGGNVGVGTSSPNGKLDVTSTSAGNNVNLIFASNLSSNANTAVSIVLGASATPSNRSAVIRGINAGSNAMNLAFLVSNGDVPEERARITSGGDLLVGRTSTFTTVGNSSGLQLTPTGEVYSASTGDSVFARRSTDGTVITFRRDTTSVGSISVTTTATAYNTSSDYRLKENIQPMQNALDVVQQLNPVTYTWKSDGSTSQGFIAHELQAVVPDCVTGEKDATEIVRVEVSPAIPATYDEDGNELTPAVEAVYEEREVPVYQGVDTSFLVATLTAAIQELKAITDAQATRIEALEAEVAALKGAN